MMPRTNRIAPGGWVFHVLNRGNARGEIFEDDGDYRAFEALVRETCARFRMRLLAYSLMPNHWHQVVWPREDGDLGRYMQRLTTTHVRRWHLHRHSVGYGHLYQGLYKSFPVQQDDHCLTVCRYVERNALRANLVKRAGPGTAPGRGASRGRSIGPGSVPGERGPEPGHPAAAAC